MVGLLCFIVLTPHTPVQRGEQNHTGWTTGTKETGTPEGVPYGLLIERETILRTQKNRYFGGVRLCDTGRPNPAAFFFAACPEYRQPFFMSMMHFNMVYDVIDKSAL